MNLSEYDFKAKCSEEDLSFLILSTSEGLVLKSSLSEDISEILSAYISLIYKESNNLFEKSIKNDKIREISIKGEENQISIFNFEKNDMMLLLISGSKVSKPIKRKMKKIIKEVVRCL